MTILVELSFDSTSSFVRERAISVVRQLILVDYDKGSEAPLRKAPSSKEIPAPLGQSAPSHSAAPVASFSVVVPATRFRRMGTMSMTVPQSPELPVLLRPPIS
ncbi:MAG: hypothetical protein NDJ90_12610 [Oligoflexia bacterium]|nr:hypothetical protein [Oligoflexia bacterium]